MFELILNFIIKYKFIFLFYLAVIIFLIIKRKKIEVQAKVIVIYRMKWGLRWMDKYSKKFREWIILFGYISVGAGFVGLIFISYVLIKNLYDLVVSPTATSGVSLVLPGINVPGLGVLPFWYWVIAIFIIALVHEFSHGIVARAHNIQVKNTGIVLLGPIIGAFVEPHEKKLRKERDIKQYSVLAAGPSSNVVLAIIALLLLGLLVPLQQSMVEPQGFTFDSYVEGDYPFAQANILPGTVITGINDQEVNGFMEFSETLGCLNAGDKLIVNTANDSIPIILAISPDNPKKGFLGIQNIRDELEIKEEYNQGLWKTAYYSLDWIVGFLRWLFILSLGIGLFNLLPLPIVDGGRMTQIFLQKLKGKLTGNKRYKQITLFFLLVLLLNLFYPFLSNLFA